MHTFKDLAMIRDCRRFERDVLGKLNILEDLVRILDSPKYDWSSEDLLIIHFDQDANIIQKYLDNKELMDYSAKLLGETHHVLVAGAVALISKLRELHLIRMEVINKFVRPDKKWVIQEDFSIAGVPKLTIEDRAALTGLTVEQQAIYEDQLTPEGYMRLGQETTKLREALLKALE